MDLKSIRDAHGLSLAEMAVKLGITSKGHVSELERGEKPISRSIALRAYEVFNGVRVGPLESLTTAEIKLLQKLERAA